MKSYIYRFKQKIKSHCYILLSMLLEDFHRAERLLLLRKLNENRAFRINCYFTSEPHLTTVGDGT